MSASILTSVKKVLGIDGSYDVFDDDILMHINSVLSTLNQLSVGPDDGFEIVDSSTTWAEYLGGDLNLNQVKTYVCLRVRLLFDPPTTSFAISAMENQIRELEWRLNVHMENIKHPYVISDDALSESTISQLTDALASKFMMVVNAGTNLNTPRPSGAGAVYWKFSAGVDVGVNGANILHGQPGDNYHVASV